MYIQNIKINYILAIIALIESFMLMGTIPRRGLEYWWLIPMIFSFVCIRWGEIFNRKKGMGVTIYLIISVVRFLIQPMMIYYSKGHLGKRLPEADSSAYEVAIIIYIIECIVAFYTINKYYNFDSPKVLSTKEARNIQDYKIQGLGVVFFLLITINVFSRLNIWLPHLNILGIKVGSISGLVMDATLFNVFKGFLFVWLLSVAYRKHNKLFLMLSIVAALFNFLSYFGQNRSFILETAITTIFTYILLFPQNSKRILLLLAPFAVIVVFTMFVNKQFGAGDTTNSIDNSYDNITDYSNMIEEYVNGLWTVARSYQASIDIPLELRISALTKDIIDGISVLRDLPFMKDAFFPMFDYLLSSSDIFKLSLETPVEYAQMLSLSGGIFIIFGNIWGWPMMLLVNYLMIRLLVYMDNNSMNSQNIFYRYMYIWMSCLMGFVHCYCVQTILYCFTRYILFFWLILFFNNIKYAQNDYKNKNYIL